MNNSMIEIIGKSEASFQSLCVVGNDLWSGSKGIIYIWDIKVINYIYIYIY